MSDLVDEHKVITAVGRRQWPVDGPGKRPVVVIAAVLLASADSRWSGLRDGTDARPAVV